MSALPAYFAGASYHTQRSQALTNRPITGFSGEDLLQKLPEAVRDKIGFKTQ